MIIILKGHILLRSFQIKYVNIENIQKKCKYAIRFAAFLKKSYKEFILSTSLCLGLHNSAALNPFLDDLFSFYRKLHPYNHPAISLSTWKINQIVCIPVPKDS